MSLGTFHHVGILVPNLDEPMRNICAMLDGKVVERGEDAALDAAWLWIASASNPIVELLAPLGDGGVLARDLIRRGSGLHHVSFSPPKLADARDHVHRCGLSVFGEDGDHGGFEEFFVHPSDTGGALFHAFRPIPQTGADGVATRGAPGAGT